MLLRRLLPLAVLGALATLLLAALPAPDAATARAGAAGGRGHARGTAQRLAYAATTAYAARGRRRTAGVRRGRSRAPVSHAADSGRRLRFGIYPWAAPGAVNAVAAQVPDDPARTLAAAKELRGERSLTVHLYGQYTGEGGDSDAAALLSDARWWSDNGMRVEMVLRYRPASPQLGAGFPAWVADVTTRLAALGGLATVQVGNEPNNTSSPAAADGAYPGAVRAIAEAIPAARRALDAAGRDDVGVGFNWAAGESPCARDAFWSQLRSIGGRALTSSVGWVGVDVYPGTWSAPAATSRPTGAEIAGSVTDALRCLRTEHMPEAGLRPSTTIAVTETGYPTDARRSPALQAAVLRETVAAVERVKAEYGVTSLCWFSLRDANTDSRQLENGYGLLNDEYRAKPAFGAYRQIIADRGL